MTKDERLYARFDIGMDEHPKIMLLSDIAFRTLIEATLYARRQLTDGFLDARVAKRKWGIDALEELASNHPERPSLERVEGGWQLRDYAEHQITRADIERKREAGRKGGRASGQARAKQEGNENEAPASNVLKQNTNDIEAKRETETETETTRTKSIVQDKPALDSEFAEFWMVYPRKQGKADALKAYKVIRRKHDAKTILAGARAYALLNIGEDKAFLKLPGGWLRGERWEDEQIVNATKTTTTHQPRECIDHPGYPLPCHRCSEGRGF